MFTRAKSSLLFLLLPAALAWSANTQLATDQPIVNFRLPMFTAEGNRTWMVRGSEARYVSREQIDLKGLNLSIFDEQPDGKVVTLLLSPSAQVRPAEQLVRGSESIRVIDDRFEATGTEWTYDHKEKKISISKNVRVVLHTELKPMLQ